MSKSDLARKMLTLAFDVLKEDGYAFSYALINYKQEFFESRVSNSKDALREDEPHEVIDMIRELLLCGTNKCTHFVVERSEALVQSPEERNEDKDRKLIEEILDKICDWHNANHKCSVMMHR